MKILLTGGAGYIGSHTYVELCKAGHESVIVDDFSNSSPVVLDRLEIITGSRPVCYRADVGDKNALQKIFSEHHFDAVIHFAGFKAVGESCVKPLRYYRNNLDTAITLCEVMEEYDVKNIVFSSSATVYGSECSSPLSEEMRTGPCSNPYGWTKYMIEQILRDFYASKPDKGVVLLRYFNPIGAHESGLIGEDPVGIPNNLMPYITQVAGGRLKELHIFGNDYPTPDGTCLRDYIHVVDLAAGHVAACNYLKDHSGCEAVNLGTGCGYSVLEMVHSFEKANDISIPYSITDRRPGDLAETFSNPEKAYRLFGWKAKKTLIDMCRDSWNWQKKNPMGYRR